MFPFRAKGRDFFCFHDDRKRLLGLARLNEYQVLRTERAMPTSPYTLARGLGSATALHVTCKLTCTSYCGMYEATGMGMGVVGDVLCGDGKGMIVKWTEMGWGRYR